MSTEPAEGATEDPAHHSYARTLRVISVLGSASVVSIILGMVKTKIAALILGPVGIGIIALLQNAAGVAATLGDAGMRQSGAREISRELVLNDSERVRRVVVTLWWMGLGLAVLSSALFFLLRRLVADRLLARPDLADDLGWSTAAVAATVIAAALTAMLNGHHRVREITWVTINSAALSCGISVAAIWLWGKAATVIFVVSAPLMLMLVSLWYVARLGVLRRLWPPSREHVALGRRLLELGVFVMLSAIALSVSELTVRLAIQRSIGAFQLGLFSAAWAIGVYYLNFLMVATSTEFFPRLSARFDDAAERNAAINHQIQAMILIAAPVAIALSAFCPLILKFMYSSQFVAATHLVRLMVIGDVLRLSIYPLGFVFIAASHGRSFFTLKLTEAGVFAGLVIILVQKWGLVGVGLAHVSTFALLFGAYCTTVAKRLAVYLSPRSIASICGLVMLSVGLALIADKSNEAAAVSGGFMLTTWTTAVGIMWIRQKRLPGELAGRSPPAGSRDVA